MATKDRTEIAEDIFRRNTMRAALSNVHMPEPEAARALAWAASTQNRLRRLLSEHKLPEKRDAAAEELIAMYRTAALSALGEDFRDADRVVKAETQATEREALREVVRAYLPSVKTLKKYLRDDPAAVDDLDYFFADHPTWTRDVSTPLQFELTPKLARKLRTEEPLLWLLGRVAEAVGSTPEVLRKRLHARPKTHR